MRYVPMQRLVWSALACSALLWASTGAAVAQGAGGAAAPEVQNAPRPAPAPFFIPSRPPPPKSDAAPEEESEQGKDMPQGGGGCRYQDRKLELIV